MRDRAPDVRRTSRTHLWRTTARLTHSHPPPATSKNKTQNRISNKNKQVNIPLGERKTRPDRWHARHRHALPRCTFVALSGCLRLLTYRLGASYDLAHRLGGQHVDASAAAVSNCVWPSCPCVTSQCQHAAAEAPRVIRHRGGRPVWPEVHNIHHSLPRILDATTTVLPASAAAGTVVGHLRSTASCRGVSAGMFYTAAPNNPDSQGSER